MEMNVALDHCHLTKELDNMCAVYDGNVMSGGVVNCIPNHPVPGNE